MECKLKDAPELTKLMGSIFLGNKTSHDSSYTETISDLQTFYADILALEKTFYCEKCNKTISKKYYDSVKKEIRCSCGAINYSWK